MDGDKFLDLCKDIVVEQCNKGKEEKIHRGNVFVVWACKTLQNNKALLSTTVPGAMYYEITHNGNKNETYVDAYKKHENIVIKH